MAKIKMDASFVVVMSFMCCKLAPRIDALGGFLFFFFCTVQLLLTMLYFMIYRDFFFVFYLHLIIEIRRSNYLEA